MIILDWCICIPLAWGAYRGFRNGFIFEIAILLALLMGFVGGGRLAHLGADYLRNTFHLSSQYLYPLSFLTIFILIVALVVLFSKLLGGAVNMIALGLVNRIAGLGFGIAKWATALSILVHLLNCCPPFSIPQQGESLLYPYLFRIGTLFYFK